MKAVYIAGPYTAPNRELEDANIDQAAVVAAEYARKGYIPFCPHTMCVDIDRSFNEDGLLQHEDYMRIGMYWLQFCDAIHMLPGWRESEGATIEYYFAKLLDLEIRGAL